jgi:hypothetical protein
MAIRPISDGHHRRTRQIRASCRWWRFHLRGGARHGGRDHEAFSRVGGTWTYRGDGIGSGCCHWISEDESTPRFCHWRWASLRASASAVGVPYAITVPAVQGSSARSIPPRFGGAFFFGAPTTKAPTGQPGLSFLGAVSVFRGAPLDAPNQVPSHRVGQWVRSESLRAEARTLANRGPNPVGQRDQSQNPLSAGLLSPTSRVAIGARRLTSSTDRRKLFFPRARTVLPCSLSIDSTGGYPVRCGKSFPVCTENRILNRRSKLSVHCRSSSTSAAEALYKLSSGCRLQ